VLACPLLVQLEGDPAGYVIHVLGDEERMSSAGMDGTSSRRLPTEPMSCFGQSPLLTNAK
jgi:hypothetical protein